MSITRRTFGKGLAFSVPALAGVARGASAQAPQRIQIGLLVPLSGLYARPGAVMKMGAEMAIADVNGAGGIRALNGAQLELVTLDCGDTTEKAKNAAQRMVAEYPNLVAATGCYLSSFTLAASEVTERANLPLLTLSYSDLITDRGFRYVFQTSATAGAQAEMALPTILQLAERASGRRPRTVAIITDNTAASIASTRAMKERLLAQHRLEMVVDETFTPPLADATPLVQRLRARRPDLFFFLPTVISDAKLVLEKMAEFNLRIPTISFGIAIAEPEVLNTVNPALLNGVMSAVANWGTRGQEALIERLRATYGEPWMTQNAISTYGDIWILQAALERAGRADRQAMGESLRTLDGGPARYFPGGEIRFDDKGRRVGAGLTIIQWQNGVPVTIFPENLALAEPQWPRS